MNGSPETSPTKREAEIKELHDLLCSIAGRFGVALPGALMTKEDLAVQERQPSYRDTPEKNCLEEFGTELWPDAKQDRIASELALLLQAKYHEVKDTRSSPRKRFPTFNSINSGALSKNTSFTTDTASTTNGSFSTLASSRRSTSAVTSATTSFDGSFDANEMGKGKNMTNAAENYRLRRFPQKGFFVEPLPAKLCQASERVRYECVRLSQACKIDVERIAEHYIDAWENYSTLWKDISKLRSANSGPMPSKTSRSAWEHATSWSTHRTAKLQYQEDSSDDKQLFRLSVNPIEELPSGQTCRFSRHFGAERFLRLDIPTDSRPQYISDQKETLEKRIGDWCRTPGKTFAGCSWEVFFIRRSKTTRKKSRASEGEKSLGYEIFLFAEEGPSLKKISILEMIRWFLPLELNHDLALHKAFARIELGLSKTWTTIQFMPSQIRQVDDILADGKLGDPNLFSDDLHILREKELPGKQRKVMNDGCSRISAAAALVVWSELNQPGPCPSAFQARIGPWKGMWMVDSMPIRGEDGDIWIEVTRSQRKFAQHLEDVYDPDDMHGPYCKDRLTFEVLDWCRKASTSRLYKEFLPILEERGVSRTCLQEFLRSGIDTEQKNFRTALQSTRSMCNWVEHEFLKSSQDTGVEDFDTIPAGYAQQVRSLLLAGFDMKYPLVAEKIKTLAKSYFRRVGIELNVPLPQSTYVFGVADPFQCLEPDEVHLAFSYPLSDSDPTQNFYGSYAIVARQPALRRSDIQKIKLVNRPELCHLLNIAVFSTHGSISIAEKLQGGDYDGDRFWFCWAPDIVKPFRNVPPTPSRDPSEFGIKVDRTKLGDLSADEFLYKGISTAVQTPTVGPVHKFWQKLCYRRGKIHDEDVENVVSIHEILMDSAKNGYSFPQEDWNVCRKQFKDYQEIESTVLQYENISENELFDRKNDDKYRKKWRNIVDYMIFQVSRPYTVSFLSKIEEKFLNLGPQDSAKVDSTNKELGSIYIKTIGDADDETVKRLLRDLKRGLETIYEEWWKKDATIPIQVENMEREQERKLPKQRILKHDEYFRFAREEYIKLDDLVNQAFPSGSPLAERWLSKDLPAEPSRWEKMKASAAIVTCGKNLDLVFNCAWSDLIYMKSHSVTRPHPVAPEVFGQLKTKNKRKWSADEEDENYESIPEENQQQQQPQLRATKSARETSPTPLRPIPRDISNMDGSNDTEDDDMAAEDSDSSDAHGDVFLESREHPSTPPASQDDEKHESDMDQISQEMQRPLIYTPKKRKFR